MTGYIKLFRQMTEWEWYKDANTKAVFLHLLLMANHAPARWRGIEIQRGQHLTSIKQLAKETGLTVQNVRTSLNHLKSTREVTWKVTSRWTLITVENYEKYQGDLSEGNKVSNKVSNKVLTRCQQGANKVLTTNKNNKEGERMIKNEEKGEASEQRQTTHLYRNGVTPLTHEESEAIMRALRGGRK